MNDSYSNNAGAYRDTQHQQQQYQLQQVGAPFSLDPAPAEVYSTPVYTVIDQIVREAIYDGSSLLSDESNMATNSPMNITPRSGKPTAQQHSLAAPLVPQQPIFQELQVSNAQTPNWDSLTATVQYTSNATENLLRPNPTGYPSYHDGVTPAWQSLSKQPSSPQSWLTTPITHAPAPHPHGAAATSSNLPQPLSIAAVTSSAHFSGSSTPAHSRPIRSNSSGSHDYGNMEVVITGAIAAGATPSSNAATHYKTKRCRHFDQSGWCPYQHRCVFAHGDREFNIYTARKNEATSGTHPKTSQQLRDHIARNVNQLVEEYELAVAEAAALARAKNATATAVANAVAAAKGTAQPATAPNNSALTMMTNVSPTQSASQVSSAASQHSSVHLMAASPLTPGSMLAQTASANSNAQVFHYQPQQQQQQQQFTVLSQQPIFISTTNNSGLQYTPMQLTRANAPIGTAFTVLPANANVQTAAPQSLYLGRSPQQQQQSQPQFLFAVQTNTQGVYQLQPASPQYQQIQPQPQQQQQQQQQIFLVEAPLFQTVQMSSSSASNAAGTTQQTQSTGSLVSHPSNGYAGTNGAAFGATAVMSRYAR